MNTNSQYSKENPEIEILLISSSKPDGKLTCSLILRRHFALFSKKIQLSVLPADVREIFPVKQSQIIKRIRKTRFAKYLDEFFWRIHTYLPIHLLLKKPSPAMEGKTVVLTLAMDNAFLIAQKYARKHKLPLVTRFADWFPDMTNWRHSAKNRLDAQFHHLNKVADAKIYISHEMAERLEDSQNGFVIYPIPESNRVCLPPKTPSKPYRICYLGNLFHYGPMLAKLAEESLAHEELSFEFRGVEEPNWPAEIKTKFRNLNQLHGYLDGPAFYEWYNGFDAYLVAMLFEEKDRRRSETCFPTKYLDYCSLGRPIIIWGPDYSAVVKWAKKNNAALCVTESDPKAVVDAIQKLASDQGEQHRLGNAARAAYEGEFSPIRLQGLFEQAIEAALNPKIL
jgi:glycosyltransferase involved in cell wall biosynthesis